MRTSAAGRASRPAELSGAVVLPSSFTRVTVAGSSFPYIQHLHAWQFPFIAFGAGDHLDIVAIRDGVLRIWPTVRGACVQT